MSLKRAKTLVHQLHATADRLKDAPSLWTKRGPQWVATSWRQYAQRVKDFALGLQSLGFGPKQIVAVMSSNREEWCEAALGAMAAGGALLGVDCTLSPEKLTFVLGHAEASVAVVENEIMLNQVMALKGSLPALKHLIVMDAPLEPRAEVLTFTEVLERGARANESDYYEGLEALTSDDLAQLLYSPGTSRAVMLSHLNLVWSTAQLALCYPVEPNDVVLSYLSLAYTPEQLCSLWGPVQTGMQVYFAQADEPFTKELKAVRPTLFFARPQEWEKLQQRVETELAVLPRSSQQAIIWARNVALRFHSDEMSHQQSSITLQMQYALARRIVFEPLKAKVGLDRAHTRVSDAGIAPEVLEFFTSMDMPIGESYGQPEASGPITVSTRWAMKKGTLGRPMPGIELRIAQNAEILVRGGNVFQGYWKDAAASAALMNNGWLKTGDFGELDADGFLKTRSAELKMKRPLP